jgi:hypothetical protein
MQISIASDVSIMEKALDAAIVRILKEDKYA